MTGWPWPLDAVQNWFENLWNSILNAIGNVASDVWKALPDWIKAPIVWINDVFKDIANKLNNFLKDPVGSLINLANKVWEFIPDWVKEPLIWISYSFKYIALGIVNFLSNPLDYLKGAFEWLTSNFLNVLSTAESVLAAIGNKVWNLLPDWIKNAITWINDVAKSSIQKLDNFLKDPVDPFRNIFNWLKDGFDSAIGAAKDTIVNTFSVAFDGAVSSIGNIFKPVIDPISSFFKDPVAFLKGIFESLWNILLGGVETTKKAWGSFLDFIIPIFSKGFLNILGGIIGIWGGIAKSIIKTSSMPEIVWSKSSNINDPPQEVYIPVQYPEAVKWLSDPLYALLKEVIGAIGKRLEEITTVTGPITHEKATENVKKFLDLIADINARVAEFDILAEVLSFGQVEVIGRALQNIAWTYGLGWLQWVALGPGLKYAIANPLEDYYTYITRPNKITRSDIEEAYRKGYIDFSTYKDRLAKLGYRDEDIEIMSKIAYKEFTMSDVRRSLELGIISEDEARDRLRKIGYRDEDIDLVLKSITFDQTEEERKLAKTDILNAFAEGILTEEQARNSLANIGYTNDAIDILLATAKKKMMEVRRITASQVLAALRERTIDTKEADQLLAELGFTERDREILIKTELAKTVITPRLPTASMILSAYRFNVIDEATARSWLETLRYDKPTIDLLIATENARIAEIEERELKKQRFPTSSQIGRAYVDGVITRDEMKKKLLELKYSEKDAELICLIYDKEKERALRKIREVPAEKKQKLSATQILEAYREGVFSGEEALTRLEALGYSIDDAMVLLEVQRRTLTPAQIIAAFRRKIISEEEARERLALQGYTDEDIDILMRLAA